MSHLNVLKNPNKELRVESRPVSVEEIQSNDMQQLVANMKETMVAENGVGLAAPQVGKHIRLIICETRQGAKAYFNPEIVQHSDRTIDSEEGCLSIPHVYGIVRRYKAVKVTALDEQGNDVTLKTGGLLAVIFQHEIDHLDGILFIDRAHTIKDMTDEKKEALI